MRTPPISGGETCLQSSHQMARPSQVAIDTFISFTGSTEVAAIQKLEVRPLILRFFFSLWIRVSGLCWSLFVLWFGSLWVCFVDCDWFWLYVCLIVEVFYSDALISLVSWSSISMKLKMIIWVFEFFRGLGFLNVWTSYCCGVPSFEFWQLWLHSPDEYGAAMDPSTSPLARNLAAFSLFHGAQQQLGRSGLHFPFLVINSILN